MRTFALYSSAVDTIKVIRSGKVRRAKLYYLRDRTGKSARISEKIKKKIGIDLETKIQEVTQENVDIQVEEKVNTDIKNEETKAAETPKVETKKEEAKPQAKAELKKKEENKKEDSKKEEKK